MNSLLPASRQNEREENKKETKSCIRGGGPGRFRVASFSGPDAGTSSYPSPSPSPTPSGQDWKGCHVTTQTHIYSTAQHHLFSSRMRRWKSREAAPGWVGSTESVSMCQIYLAPPGPPGPPGPSWAPPGPSWHGRWSLGHSCCSLSSKLREEPEVKSRE